MDWISSRADTGWRLLGAFVFAANLAWWIWFDGSRLSLGLAIVFGLVILGNAVIRLRDAFDRQQSQIDGLEMRLAMEIKLSEAEAPTRR